MRRESFTPNHNRSLTDKKGSGGVCFPILLCLKSGLCSETSSFPSDYDGSSAGVPLVWKKWGPHYHMRVWLWHWWLVTNTAWCTTLAYKGIKESVLTRGVQPEENHTYRNIMKLPISGEWIKKKLKLWSQQGNRHQFYSLCGDNYLKLIFGRRRFLQNS